jgi:hypothetical protein
MINEEKKNIKLEREIEMLHAQINQKNLEVEIVTSEMNKVKLNYVTNGSTKTKKQML